MIVNIFTPQERKTMSTENTDDKDLDYTRQMRMRLAEDMTKGQLPTDNKDRMTLLAVLDGMDRAALANKRLKSEEGANNAKAIAAETIAMMFMDPRLKAHTKSQYDPNRPIPVLREDLPVPDVVEGELDASPAHETYESFMSKHGNIRIIETDEDDQFKEV